MKRILIVDDEPTARQLLGAFLKSDAYETVFREDGYSAMELLKNEKFDLVILDIFLPHFSGLKVLQEMRNTPALQFTPVIMLTSSEDEDDVDKAKKIGISAYLIKPPQKHELLPEVEKALDQSEDF